MWAVDDTWGRVFTALMAQADADEDLDWAVSLDSTASSPVCGRGRENGPWPVSPATTPSAGHVVG